MTNRKRTNPRRSVSVNEARRLANIHRGESRSRTAAPPAGAVPGGQVFAFNPSAPPEDLPRKVTKCRAARHAICEELFSALHGEKISWLSSPKHQPRSLGDVAAAVAAVTADPVEHFKRCWVHAAERAADEGFRFEAAPTGYSGKEPCAHIRCDHSACRDHSRDSVSIVVSGDAALKGLEMSGLIPEMDPVERCDHRRRSVLGANLSEMSSKDRFIVPAGFKAPSGMTVLIVENGMGVAVACKHAKCAAAGKQEVGVSWDPTMAMLADGG